MATGVQGYIAFLRGKRVTYMGGQGDQDVSVPPTPSGGGPQFLVNWVNENVKNLLL
jgi:hypothetical protein